MVEKTASLCNDANGAGCLNTLPPGPCISSPIYPTKHVAIEGTAFCNKNGYIVLFSRFCYLLAVEIIHLPISSFRIRALFKCGTSFPPSINNWWVHTQMSPQMNRKKYIMFFKSLLQLCNRWTRPKIFDGIIVWFFCRILPVVLTSGQCRWSSNSLMKARIWSSRGSSINYTDGFKKRGLKHVLLLVEEVNEKMVWISCSVYNGILASRCHSSELLASGARASFVISK